MAVGNGRWRWLQASVWVRQLDRWEGAAVGGGSWAVGGGGWGVAVGVWQLETAVGKKTAAVGVTRNGGVELLRAMAESSD